MNLWFVLSIIFINVWVLIALSKVGKKIESRVYTNSDVAIVGA